MKLELTTLVLVIGIPFARPVASTEESGSMKMVEKQTKDQGLMFSATLPKKCYAGERIDLTISMKNKRKDGVVYYESSPAQDFNIVVKNSKGKPVPFTEFGKSTVSRKDDASRIIEKTLPPGEEVSGKLNLSRLFDLTKAGDYSLHLEREMILNEKDESGTTKFKRINLKLEFPFRIYEPPK